jgi:hypothetical protein
MNGARMISAKDKDASQPGETARDSIRPSFRGLEKNAQPKDGQPAVTFIA